MDPKEVFIDATHVKACANNKKMQKQFAKEEALFYEELLKKEINEDRELALYLKERYCLIELFFQVCWAYFSGSWIEMGRFFMFVW